MWRRTSLPLRRSCGALMLRAFANQDLKSSRLAGATSGMSASGVEFLLPFQIWLGTPILGKAEGVRSAPCSDINLLGYRERIVDLDTRISDSALDLRMSEQ